MDKTNHSINHSTKVKNVLTNEIIKNSATDKSFLISALLNGFEGYKNMSLDKITDLFVNMFGWEKYSEAINNIIESDNKINDKNDKIVKYIAYFDASRNAETGEGILAYAIRTSDNKLIVRDAFIANIKSSHVGESLALLKLLDKALNLGIKDIEIYGDDQSLIEKANNRKKPKHGKSGFNGYLPSIVNRIDKFNQISIKWSDRSNNRYADMLCRLKKRGVDVYKTGGKFELKELERISKRTPYPKKEVTA